MGLLPRLGRRGDRRDVQLGGRRRGLSRHAHVYVGDLRGPQRGRLAAVRGQGKRGAALPWKARRVNAGGLLAPSRRSWRCRRCPRWEIDTSISGVICRLGRDERNGWCPSASVRPGPDQPSSRRRLDVTLRSSTLCSQNTFVPKQKKSCARDEGFPKYSHRPPCQMLPCCSCCS